MSNTPPDWREAARAEYRERRAVAAKRLDQYAQRLKRLRSRITETEEEIAELDRGAKVFGLIEEALQPDLPLAGEDGRPTAVRIELAPGSGKSSLLFKVIALEFLRSRYPHPVKAAEITEEAQAKLGREFHWKTAGMTLYRLKKDGVVRRRGQDWYFVPPEQRPDAEHRSQHEDLIG